jgi:hypothetical protein
MGSCRWTAYWHRYSGARQNIYLKVRKTVPRPPRACTNADRERRVARRTRTLAVQGDAQAVSATDASAV